MKQEHIDAIAFGKIIMTQTFVTEKGVYKLTHLRHNDFIYFIKERDGKIVEMCNLNRKKVKEEKNEN